METIKDVTTPVLREALIAVQDLRRKYQGAERSVKYGCFSSDSDRERCPLCAFSEQNGYSTPFDHSCQNGNESGCPWIWFKGTWCQADGGYEDETEELTFARIDNWEQRIVAELQERDQLQVDHSTERSVE